VTEPERWLTSDDAPAEMARMLRAARADEPDDATISRMALRLRTPAVAPGRRWIPAVVAGGAAVGLFVWLWPKGSAEPRPVERPTVAAPATIPAPAGGPPSEAAPVAPVPTDDSPAPAKAQNDAPAALPSELSLIRAARNALSSDPGRALSLLDRHRQLYPSGQLAEEREVLAIDALRRLGRTQEADARARRFLTAHPQSAHRARLERESGLSSK
jgi:hypothetical protein